jgi:hypothetical protein
VARRESSNSALQALTLLNDAMYLEAARALGQSVAGLTDDEQAISAMFRRVLTRSPDASDAHLCLKYLQAEFKRLSNAPESVKALAGDGGNSKTAARVSLARVLLNLDEAVTRP